MSNTALIVPANKHSEIMVALGLQRIEQFIA